MLELPDVTLVAHFTVCHEMTRMAVDECTTRVSFGDVKIFTDQARGQHEVLVPALEMSLDKMMLATRKSARFTTYELPSHIKTSHALFIHWDSWVIDPGMWTNEFLKYDYIGAPWWYTDGYNVGNSGFCLRSKKLLDFLASHEDEFPFRMPEDDTLCRHYRRRLPQFRWAPEGLAHQFAFERVRGSPRSFGFHGVFNWTRVLSGEELKRRVELARANPYARSRPEHQELERMLASELAI